MYYFNIQYSLNASLLFLFSPLEGVQAIKMICYYNESDRINKMMTLLSDTSSHPIDHFAYAPALACHMNIKCGECEICWNNGLCVFIAQYAGIGVMWTLDKQMDNSQEIFNAIISRFNSLLLLLALIGIFLILLSVAEVFRR